MNVVVRRFQLFQCGDDSQKFHSVVGGFSETFGESFLVAFFGNAHKNSISAFSGISAASAVGVYFYSQISI
jgi:hypothetical protein